MPWVRRRLRGQEVLARCDEDGKLVAEDGRVEIRYRPTDGRAYRAALRNLEPARDPTVLPDSHCVPAEAAPDRRASGEGEGAGKKKKAPAARGARAAAGAATGGSQAAVVAYADGACTGNPGPCGLGALVIDGASRDSLSEYLGVGTNNIAELTAILRVAERLAGDARPIEIRTDSQYSIGVLSKGWKAKANQALVAEVKAALARVPSTRLVYVPGHAGEPGNERVDALAREAVSRRASRPWKAE